MSKLQKAILLLVVAVVALVVVVLLGLNMIVRTSVSPAVRTLTGFDASVGDVDVRLFSSKIAIKNLKVTNPSDFAEKRLLDAPEIYVEYKLGSLMSSRREFPVMRLNVAEVVYVKNEKGESNVKRINDATSKSKGPGAAHHYGTFEYTIGKVILMDYTKMIGGKPLTRELVLNLHQIVHDVSDDEMKRLVMLPGLQAFAGKIGDITPATLQKGLTNVTGTAGSVASKLTEAAAEAAKGIGGLFQSKTNAQSKRK
jgi:hypothetical protein